jgi:hypothetical protein
LITKHGGEYGVEVIMKLDFSGVDEVIIGGSDIHVKVSEIFTSAVGGEGVEGLDAGGNEVDEIDLVVANPLVIRVILERIVYLRLV